jgi:ribosomal protein L37AE/L43A
MKVNLDGTFEIEKGETIPFVCPKCNFPIVYDKNLVMVKCHQCKYLGDKDEFSNELILKK